MDNYNVLVLMQKDPDTKELMDTVLSVQMEEGLDNVLKAYVSEEDGELFTYLYLTTPDVEDWEFYGIYEEYPEDLFASFNGTLEEIEEYNPAWRIRFPYMKSDNENEELLRKVVKLHYNKILELRESIKIKKEEYMNMVNEEES